MSVGLLGAGVYFPEVVRKNDWWPAAIVDQWRQHRAANVFRGEKTTAETESPGVRLMKQALAEVGDDLFGGVKERRVMSKGQVPSDMELAAAKDALARANVRPEEIDMLLVFSALPDFLLVPQAPLLHEKLGLKRECLAMDTNSSCVSFAHQLMVARRFIESGAVKKALLIQSAAAGHVTRPEDHHSVWFGDAATAQVVGEVAEGRGILSDAFYSDGSYHRGLVCGSPEQNWYEAEKIYLYNADRTCARGMLLGIVDMSKEMVELALKRAHLEPAQVDFYAAHQPTLGFRKVSQNFIGMTRAKSFDTFSWTGNLAPVNCPLMLALGEREGVLKEGDVAVIFAAGNGISVASTVVRWGR